MALLPARVSGPLSECSSAVRVKGQLTGSTVEILADEVRVGGGAATWPNQLFALDAGVALTPGASVTATQTLGADTSAASPEFIEVQAKPPVVGHVGFRSHLYICGECLWLDGMVPGAKVEIRAGGALRASGTAHDGEARLGLSSPIGSGDVLEAQQTACGEPGPVTPGPLPDPVPGAETQWQLAPPKVVPPLKECQRAATAADVFEGARVTLSRSGGPDVAACFDAKSLWFRVDPLTLGESITARQEFPACDRPGEDSAPVQVESAEPVPAPTLPGPLCSGANSVSVTGLLPGSKIRILQDGSEIGIGEAPDQDTFDFPADPPLAGGTLITAQQELCDIWSDPSAGAVVDPSPEELPTPVIREPLFRCAAVVRVENLHPGVRVYVYSELLGAPIGSKFVTQPEEDVQVAPQLIAGDEIHALQIGCGLTSEPSDTVPVLELTQINPPNVVPPLDDCMQAVLVENVVPGARVDVYVNNTWASTRLAAESPVAVPLPSRLQAGDEVRARQRICDITTEFGESAGVNRNTTGTWEGPYDTPVFAAHAALVYNRITGRAKVLMFAGGGEHKYALESWLWDPETSAFTRQTWNPPGREHDLFCAHHAFLEDGRLLVMGGSIWDEPAPAGSDHAKGVKISYLFDPISELWQKVGDLAFGRWYPTAAALPNGKVLVFSGQDETRTIVPQVELFDPAAGALAWTTLPESADKSLSIYPGMHLVPAGPHAGRIFYTGTRWAGGSTATSAWSAPDSVVFDPASQNWPTIIDDHVHKNRTEGMSVLLPPAQDARFLVIGGGHNASDNQANSAEIIDLTHPNPTWQTTPDMSFRRSNVNGVILPDGTVFVLGGHQQYKWNADPEPVYECAIYHPDAGTGSWSPAASMTKPRQYHSAALLLPDGRVLAAGGIDPSQSEELIDQRNMEIYSPPYRCRPTRPELTSAPDVIFYGGTFTVGSPQAGTIGCPHPADGGHPPYEFGAAAGGTHLHALRNRAAAGCRPCECQPCTAWNLHAVSPGQRHTLCGQVCASIPQLVDRYLGAYPRPDREVFQEDLWLASGPGLAFIIPGQSLRSHL